MNKKLKIAVVCQLLANPDRERLRGILRYASSRQDWDVVIYPQHPAHHAPPPPASFFDGLISSAFFLKSIEQANGLRKIRPAVLFDPDARACHMRNTTLINPDDNKIGVLAAEFFLRRKFVHFAFVGSLQARPWSAARQHAFANRLAKAGYRPAVYRSSIATPDWKSDEHELVSWMRSLPKPCALFAANDYRAAQILNACRAADISVPQQLSVLSVDDEEFLCETCSPTLSSMRVEFEESGYRGAEILDGMIRSGKALPRQTFGVKGIVERASTADSCGVSRIVSEACEFIRKNAKTAIHVEDIARAVGVSIRLLERDFAISLNLTPTSYLQQQKLNLIAETLRKTTTPVGEVGTLCGFANAKYLKTLFKSHFGCTMTAYRIATHSRRSKVLRQPR